MSDKIKSEIEMLKQQLAQLKGGKKASATTPPDKLMGAGLVANIDDINKMSRRELESFAKKYNIAETYKSVSETNIPKIENLRKKILNSYFFKKQYVFPPDVKDKDKLLEIFKDPKRIYVKYSRAESDPIYNKDGSLYDWAKNHDQRVDRGEDPLPIYNRDGSLYDWDAEIKKEIAEDDKERANIRKNDKELKLRREALQEMRKRATVLEEMLQTKEEKNEPPPEEKKKPRVRPRGYEKKKTIKVKPTIEPEPIIEPEAGNVRLDEVPNITGEVEDIGYIAPLPEEAGIPKPFSVPQPEEKKKPSPPVIEGEAPSKIIETGDGRYIISVFCDDKKKKKKEEPVIKEEDKTIEDKLIEEVEQKITDKKKELRKEEKREETKENILRPITEELSPVKITLTEISGKLDKLLSLLESKAQSEL